MNAINEMIEAENAKADADAVPLIAAGVIDEDQAERVFEVNLDMRMLEEEGE